MVEGFGCNKPDCPECKKARESESIAETLARLAKQDKKT